MMPMRGVMRHSGTGNPSSRSWRGEREEQVERVVGGAGDGERLAETAGSAGEETGFGGGREGAI